MTSTTTHKPLQLVGSSEWISHAYRAYVWRIESKKFLFNSTSHRWPKNFNSLLQVTCYISCVIILIVLTFVIENKEGINEWIEWLHVHPLWTCCNRINSFLLPDKERIKAKRTGWLITLRQSSMFQAHLYWWVFLTELSLLYEWFIRTFLARKFPQNLRYPQFRIGSAQMFRYQIDC